MGPDTLFGARGNSEDIIGSFRIPIDESAWYEEEAGMHYWRLMFGVFFLYYLYVWFCSLKYFLYSLQSRYFSLLSEGSGFDEDSSFRLDEIDRQTLMVTLADLEYILVRATHGESAQVIG